MEVYPCFIAEDFVINVALFDDVGNIDILRDSVINGGKDVALINPQMLVDRFQVLCAATKALHSSIHGKMTTRNIHSEIIFNLSATKNISDAFRKFGTSKNDSAVLLVQIKEINSCDTLSDFLNTVSGRQISSDEIHRLTDENNIKKIFRIKESELESGTLLEAVVGRAASKDIVTL